MIGKNNFSFMVWFHGQDLGRKDNNFCYSQKFFFISTYTKFESLQKNKSLVKQLYLYLKIDVA
jgi:hypothetical protein